MMLCFPTSPI